MAENPAAFPSFETREQYKDDGYHTVLDSHGGMTLRDYFAAKAMGGLMANDEQAILTVEKVARWSYGVAEAMLIERERRISNGV